MGAFEALIFLLATALAADAVRHLYESVSMRGDVKVWLVDVSTGDRQLHAKQNLIVRNGKTIMAKLLGGDAAYKNIEHISKVAFGTSATAAVDTQTALVSEQFVKAATVDYPAFNQVRFSSTMEAAEGGSNIYQELGLKTAGGNLLFSRIVIAAITKSSAYKIQVEWTISFQ